MTVEEIIDEITNGTFNLKELNEIKDAVEEEIFTAENAGEE
jgi:hypothetical protein